VPVDRQAEGFHKYVEFGNRLLTFVLAVIIVAAIVAAFRHRPRRPVLLWLAAAGLAGVVGQAVLGGITVLTGLNPYTVSAHFLLSAALIAAAVALYERGNEAGDAPARSLVRPEIRWLTRALVALGAVVVVLGTVVTGSGPHSGDADAAVRFGLDPRAMSWLHADVVLLFLGLTVALGLALRLTDGPVRAQRRVWVLLAFSLAQGLIGYVQYFTGLPELVVGLHLLGACLVWVLLLRIPFTLRTRVEQAAEPSPAPESVVA
jgi:heme a synthase